MTSRDIRRTCINEFTVNLIREQEQIVLLYQITNLIHFSSRIQITGRVIRITYQNTFGPFVYQLFKLLNLRKGETFFDCSRYGTNNCSCRNSKRHIIGIRRFWYNDFITRIQTAQKSKQYSFRTSCCNNDIIRIQMNGIFLIIPNELFPITTIALTGTILKYCAVDMSNRIKGGSRSRQIRLTDIQMIDMDSSLFCILCQRSQLSDR